VYTYTDTSYVIYTSQKIKLNDLFIECSKIQTFNGLPIHLIEILHEKEKEKYGRGFIFHRQRNLVIAHKDKHPKGVGYVVAQKMNEMKKKFIHSWTIKIDPSNPNLDDQRLKTMTV
jgi:hypothetical protein